MLMNDLIDKLRVVAATALAVLVVVVVVVAARADDITVWPSVLMKNKEVVSIDEDGVRLAAPSRLFPWNEIVSGKVAAKDQERFDKLRAALSDPLREVHQALVEGRPGEALKPAEAIFPTFAARRSTAAYHVSQALVWARVEAHRPEEAIEPQMVCLSLQTVKDLGSLPGKRRPRNDPRTGLSAELAPVGLDQARAAAVLPRVRARAAALGAASPPGVKLYAAATALAAGDPAAVDAELAALSSGGELPRAVSEVADAFRAQTLAVRGKQAEAIARLETLSGGCLDSTRPIVGYLLGTDRLHLAGGGDPTDGVLDLLGVAAFNGEDHPALAAAALFAAQQALTNHHDTATARPVRVELLRAYASTDHGVRLAAELGPSAPEALAAAEARAADERTAAAEATRKRAEAAGPAPSGKSTTPAGPLVLPKARTKTKGRSR